MSTPINMTSRSRPKHFSHAPWKIWTETGVLKTKNLRNKTKKKNMEYERIENDRRTPHIDHDVLNLPCKTSTLMNNNL